MNKINVSNLHFDISSGLKSVLGSELITDDEVAIFELVKNSFDAESKHVNIFFENNKIIVADDGIGMTYEDIQNKWLFVAYSSKNSLNKTDDYREDIYSKRHYAGSKGIGRFSSDRLGNIIHLQTRSINEKEGYVHQITVNWHDFDKNYKNHFGNIPIKYSNKIKYFIGPSKLKEIKNGTVITIEETKKVWDRKSMLRLKSALAKLINPFGAERDHFVITMHCEAELVEDSYIVKQNANNVNIMQNAVVNGDVGNFIFSTLQEKTTFIEVKINKENNTIESKLIDRGEIIYRISEKNTYSYLHESDFSCQIYYLNQSAKITFARRMGVPSVSFGSIFLFRNGFRVFPIGNEGDDWFGIDRRKQQGYARFLGTRDVIGRIDVSGSDKLFQETSSRNTGLIDTDAVEQLKKCFWDKCFRRLERYVVPVTFLDKEDKNTSDISRLMTDPGRARVTAVVAKLVDSEDVLLLDYSKNLIGIINERSSEFESSIASLRAIAEKTNDQKLIQKISIADKRFQELRRSEEAARKQADEERIAKQEAINRAKNAEKLNQEISFQLVEEKKRNLFLSSISTLDTDIIINLHHQITMYSVDIQQQIENFIVKISATKNTSRLDIIDGLDRISLLNKKIMGITKFATKANFRLESEMIDADLGEYIVQYINDIAKNFLHGPLTIEVENDEKGFRQKFNPINVSVIIDNLIANSRKKNTRATRIIFKITHPEKNIIHINISDNGRGFDSRIENIERIFEKGFTMTDGSGLGLYHVRHVLGEMKGTISAQKSDNSGANFLIRISK
jgi:signal transduction histidine kinase